MAQGFQAGSTVQLKSGGPIMAVTRMADDNAVCTWFDSKHVLQHGSFPVATLKPFDTEGPGAGMLA